MVIKHLFRDAYKFMNNSYNHKYLYTFFMRYLYFAYFWLKSFEFISKLKKKTVTKTHISFKIYILKKKSNLK